MFDAFTFQLEQITYFTFINDYNNKSKYLDRYWYSNPSANDKIKELEELKHKNIDFVIVKLSNSLEENNKEHVKEVENKFKNQMKIFIENIKEEN